MSKRIACRLTFEGFKYRIESDGRILGQVRQGDPEMSPVVDVFVRDRVLAEAARQRRNRNRRERDQAHRDLGLVKTPYGWE